MVFEEALILMKWFKSQIIFDEAKELYNAVLATPDGDIVEVGSATGGTTILLMGAAEQKNKIVYSIDPYPSDLEGVAAGYDKGLMTSFKQQFKENILDGPWSNNVIQYNVTTDQCIQDIPERLSVVFIDSCHELSMVKDEIKLLYPKIVQQGRLYVHDIHMEEGQLTSTPENGLSKIFNFILENEEMFLFSSTKKITFVSGREMLCIEKVRK